MPDFDVTVLYEEELAADKWIYYEQDGFTVTLANWLNGRLPISNIEQKALNMTSEEEEYATEDFNYSIKLQEELDKNEEYKDLLLERKEILRSNGFINKLQPRFEAICERLQEIDNETQKKLWGEVVLKDSEDEDIDFSFGTPVKMYFKKH